MNGVSSLVVHCVCTAPAQHDTCYAIRDTTKRGTASRQPFAEQHLVMALLGCRAHCASPCTVIDVMILHTLKLTVEQYYLFNMSRTTGQMLKFNISERTSIGLCAHHEVRRTDNCENIIQPIQ